MRNGAEVSRMVEWKYVMMTDRLAQHMKIGSVYAISTFINFYVTVD